MAEQTRFLAFDLGAGSGRAVLGTLEEGRLRTKEVSRFPNGMLRLRGHHFWNIYGLYEKLRDALVQAARDPEGPPVSVAVDTWGVDFCLLAADGSLLGLPFAYRDHRTQGMPGEFFRKIPARRVYEKTGVQTMAINTLFQLYSMVREKSPLLDAARTLLMMPEALSYFFSGVKRSERTIASTSQIFNPGLGTWDPELVEVLGIRPGLLGEVGEPGSVLGPLSLDLSREAGLEGVSVVAGAGHDTAAAVAAVPAEGGSWAYVSCGTWSLIGVELEDPLLSDAAFRMNFTNEGGVEGKVRFLKNVSGLWLLQECRRAWGDPPYEKLVEEARLAEPFQVFLDPDWEGFLNPPDMPAAVREFCERTGQETPSSRGGLVRAVLESLALKYRLVLEGLEEVLGRKIEKLHLVGGGARNGLLCRFTAEATGLPVEAGPYEATSIGNLLVQAMALGAVKNLEEIRKVVRGSFPLESYLPGGGGDWEKALARYREFLERTEKI